MELAFNLLLTLLIELPIVAFFFRQRKRKYALSIAFFANIITWPIVNIIRINTDWNLNWVEVGVVIAEGFAYWLLLGRHVKRSIIITILANTASFFATKYIHIGGSDIIQQNSAFIK
jgi:hypothetical protein